MAPKRETMAPVDTAWLRMEDPTNLMMITGVLMFDEPIDFSQLQLVIERRLLVFDRFRQRAVRQVVGPPTWEFDPNFNIRAHLRRIALPSPGDQLALQELVSDMMSTPLDFSKPLWQFQLVDRYGSGSALICRLHHSIADGIALVHVLLSLTDSSPDADDDQGDQPEPRHKQRSPIEQIVTPALNAMDSTIRVTERIIGNDDADTIESRLNLNKIGDNAVAGAAATGKLLLMPPDARTIFRGPLGVAKRAVWSDKIPLDQVKSIGRIVGGTINRSRGVSGAARSSTSSRRR